MEAAISATWDYFLLRFYFLLATTLAAESCD